MDLFSFFSLFTCIVFLHSMDARADDLSFNYSAFELNPPNITFQMAAVAWNKTIQLTGFDQPRNQNSGRFFHKQPLHLWYKNESIRTAANFTTHFKFSIDPLGEKNIGDGFTFMITPNISSPHLGGENLATFADSGTNQIVAVEFDTYSNPSARDPGFPHIGIDVGSIISVESMNMGVNLSNKVVGNAWISYNPVTINLLVYVSFDQNPVYVPGRFNLSHIVNLSTFLPETVYFGFGGTVGGYKQLSTIYSWDFASEIQVLDKKQGSSDEPFAGETSKKKKKNLAVPLSVTGIFLSLGFLLVGYFLWSGWRKKKEKKSLDVTLINDELNKGLGHKIFSYAELDTATDGFNEKNKLGEGGFGEVYRGFLRSLNMEVAIKRISKGSKQGRKEYISEVKIISRLRHRNLVQLIGWCHERRELILVYEFMVNGSLDSHLFHEKRLLAWNIRYKIVSDLASVLLYLHEESGQHVVHRDIKPSNVLLDSNFDAKLGDFGLARLIDQKQDSAVTVLAGTFGYLAPECATIYKPTKSSDVYSFGVVALEIASGRKCIKQDEEDDDKVKLVDWARNLYEKDRIFDVIDDRLDGMFIEDEMMRLLIVGLWCANPNHNKRPSMTEVKRVLNMEAELPELQPLEETSPDIAHAKASKSEHGFMPYYESSTESMSLTLVRH